MKRTLILIIVLAVAIIATSCVPVEPKDMLPYCQNQYAILLDQYPDFPHAYVGACVAYLQSGKPTAFVSLCGYEPFRELVEESEDIILTSKKECMAYIRNLEE